MKNFIYIQKLGDIEFIEPLFIGYVDVAKDEIDNVIDAFQTEILINIKENKNEI